LFNARLAAATSLLMSTTTTVCCAPHLHTATSMRGTNIMQRTIDLSFHMSEFEVDPSKENFNRTQPKVQSR
jgi:hypothetical protein